jgi:hypothetical protein
MPETRAVQLSELKIPASQEFIGVAKRVATSLGSKLGFSLDELDELGIAVVQACGLEIEAAEDLWGEGATIKLNYSSTGSGIAVDVEALPPHAAEALDQPRKPVRRQRANPPHPARALRADRRDVEAQRAMAEAMIRLFVDDFAHQVEGSQRQIRYRMVKYLVS